MELKLSLLLALIFLISGINASYDDITINTNWNANDNPLVYYNSADSESFNFPKYWYSMNLPYGQSTLSENNGVSYHPKVKDFILSCHSASDAEYLYSSNNGEWYYQTNNLSKQISFNYTIIFSSGDPNGYKLRAPLPNEIYSFNSVLDTSGSSITIREFSPGEISYTTPYAKLSYQYIGIIQGNYTWKFKLEISVNSRGFDNGNYAGIGRISAGIKDFPENYFEINTPENPNNDSDGDNSTNITDTTAPSLIVISPTSQIYNESITINITATDDFGLNSIWYSDGINNFSYSSPQTINLPDGNYVYTFYAKDSSENIASQTINFAVNSSANSTLPLPDTTAPTISNLTASQISNTTNVVVDFTTNENSTAYFNLDSNLTNINFNSFANNFEYILQNLSEGNYTITIYVSDSSGNIASQTINFSVVSINQNDEHKNKKHSGGGGGGVSVTSSSAVKSSSGAGIPLIYSQEEKQDEFNFSWIIPLSVLSLICLLMILLIILAAKR